MVRWVYALQDKIFMAAKLQDLGERPLVATNELSVQPNEIIDQGGRTLIENRKI